MIDTLRASYREEAAELLVDLESALLDLERSPEDTELISRAFRDMHTIKGSGAMFDFTRIASFAHEVESAFDLVRAGKLSVTQPLITLTLDAKDHIKTLLESEFGGPAVDAAEEARLLAGFRAFLTPAPEPSVAFVEPEPAATNSPVIYKIRFRPSRDIFRTGVNPLLLMRSLHDLGVCSIEAQLQELPELGNFDPEDCYVSWDVILRTSEDENEIRDIFLFVEDTSELIIERTNYAPDLNGCDPIREPATKKSEVPADTAVPDPAVFVQETASQMLRDPDGPNPVQAPAPASQERVKTEASSSIRVKAEKLDGLVNTVGELVTAQARLAQLAAASGNPEFEFAAEEIERLIDRLRTDTMSIRMLPIGATFARFQRLVRDLSRELGKSIELWTDGEETELDKTLIDQLSDPLVHIIRNSIDHGIESPGVRVASGKPAQGTIRLSAVHSGAHVLVRISDDGAGLDRDVILAKAIERGIVPAGAQLSDEQVFGLIFQPGFSTAKQVTSVSGRGVGLDVVQRAITALRGSIEVRSRKGEGVTFTLKLPLTLAIVDGLLVSIGKDYYVMPVNKILECVELASKQTARSNGRRMVTVRDELIPYISLREHFGIAGDPPEISQVMLAETEYGKIGFLVDRVIGDHQTVIKSLGSLYRHIESISGATILGDGGVALVLDLDKLVKESTNFVTKISHPSR